MRMRPMPRCLAALWLTGLFAAQVQTQTHSATLSGRIVDATGAVVRGATVAVEGADGAPQLLTTGDDGAFALVNLAAGTYHVTVQGPGFSTAVVRVPLKAGEARRVSITLQVAAVSEDVTVTSTSIAGPEDAIPHIPGSLDVIDRATLDRSRVFTTHEALRKVPGIHARDEEGLGLRPNLGLRGLNPTRSSKLLLLEDGIPLTYAPYGDNASYYHPPVERFDAIEVLKGSGQIAYGPSTVGGVINYITPAPPLRRSGTFSLVGGNRDYFNGHAAYGGSIGRSGVLLHYMRKQADGARENLHHALNDANAKMVSSLTGRQTLTVRSNYYSEDSNVAYSGLREDEYRADPRQNPFKNDFFYIDRYGNSATHTYAWTNLLLTTNAYFSSFKRHWWRQSSNSGQRPNDASDPNCAGMANLNTTCGNEGRLRQYYTWGVEPRARLFHTLFGVRSETDFGVRAHYEVQNRLQKNGATPTARDGELIEDNERVSDAYASFVQTRFLVGSWTVTPGVRFEHMKFGRTNRIANRGAGVTGRTDVTQVVPGVGVAYRAGEAATLFAGIHRGFAPPRVEDVISNSGGVIELDPELSWNAEVGARAQLTPGLRADATFFRMDYENQIVGASLAGGVGSTLTNGGQTLHQGVEIAGRFDSAYATGMQHNVYARVAYTYVPVARFTGTRVSSNGVNVSGNRLPYAPERLVTASLGYAHPRGFDGMIEAVSISDQFGDDLNTVMPTADGQRGLIPGHVVWNMAVSQRLGAGRSTLFFTMKNLLDTTYIVDRARGVLPGSPRLVQAGIRVRF
jgi:Fe(3+) dicitrate transport protein